MLEPTRIYAQDCLDLVDNVDVHAFSHITGGGIAANIARVLPAHLAIEIDRSTWSPQPIFGLIASGGVQREDMERTFNMGMGMVALVDPTAASDAMARLRDRGVDAWPCGVVRDRRDGEVGDAEAKGGAGGAAFVVGEHPA
ncbi:MAG: hypothetical protein B7C55_08280 [Actinomycetales bacterium mxb001]|nr:MAG: hypothetical protein B7C55_08280 [Actinomycetales bacterium mxb001]